MKLIVGLGNPGERYANTRHNAGFRVLDFLGLSFQKGFSGLQAKKGDWVYLKPLTYMNRSGDSVLACSQFYRIQPDQIFVIHDELDLPFESIRYKKGGGHAGHNGLRDIGRVLGLEFHRIRFGIGRPEQKMQVADYVLSNFSTEEQQKLPTLIEQSIELLNEHVHA
ncbi:MAG: aminoacyl-tRNA hydrolase [Myxococcaceae bacterium]|nr:aminoacyl-tRNA hydrolase [Myxococcaceae bacterium]MBH2006342.1 aminoacyl-tRNA hydrolase [Myxococcaceae bacterium]